MSFKVGAMETNSFKDTLIVFCDTGESIRVCFNNIFRRFK